MKIGQWTPIIKSPQHNKEDSHDPNSFYKKALGIKDKNIILEDTTTEEEIKRVETVTMEW